jgi:hypothetical protein
MPGEDAIVWRVTDELLYTRRVTDATYAEALGVLGDRRLLSTVTIAAYYEYVSMLLNVDRYPLPADAPAEAAAAARALVPLADAELRREVAGVVSARSAIRNEDTGRALEALRAVLIRGTELPDAAHAQGAFAVMAHWWRTDNPGPGAGSAIAEASYRFAEELLATRFVSDESFAAALDALGERGLVNLMVLMGYSNIRCAQQALEGARCML